MSYKKQFLKSNFNLIFLLLAVILFGFFFRSANLASKVFWVDEVATAVRVSGYTISEVANSLSAQDIIDRDTLLAFLRLNSDRTFADSLNALIQSPEHAPLYFILTRWWMQWQGNSIAMMRCLPVIFSLCALPSMYWLCRELFQGYALVGRINWMAVGIMSISPFYVAYAQEARPYSLWTVTILLAGASFLRGIRLNNLSAWFLHSLCLILSFYTSLFSLYLAAFQGLYLLLQTNRKNIAVIRNYILTTILALIAFAPWILVVINHLDLLHDNTSWMRGNFNPADILAVYIGTVLLIFGDLPLSLNSNPIQVAIALLFIVIVSLLGIKFYPRSQPRASKFIALIIVSGLLLVLLNNIYLDWITIIGALVAIAIISLSIYSLYYLISRTHQKLWLYIVCLMLALPLPLLIADIINQGQSSTAPRYLIPLQLGILIAVAFTVANQLNASRRRLWQVVISGFIIVGIYSNVRNLNTSPFYQKGRNINNLAIAKIINRQSQSLVMVEKSEAMDLVSLAHSLTPEVKYKIIERQINLSQYANQFAQAYILKPSPALKDKLQSDSKIQLEQVYKSHVFSADEFPLDLWKIY